MCGIAGFINKNDSIKDPDVAIKQMTDRLVHRGPDAEGIWVDESKNIALGHRRLSIIDLSSGGSQPMASSSGRFIMVFNGEIYNFKELRKLLINKGVKFNSSSDTEVVLAMLEEYGLEQMIMSLFGMFAISIWDNVSKEMILIRDRAGEKPLYYGINDSAFFFGSELSFIKDAVFIEKEIDQDMIPVFLEKSCIPAPNTIYKNIYKLLPGSFIKIKYSELLIGKSSFLPTKYWQFSINPSDEYNEFNTAKIKLDEELNNVVKQQMIADVSLGTFLSGGVDSSLITAIMQRNSEKKIKTYSIGFEEEKYNEAPFAAAIAKYLGTDHHEQILTNNDIKDLAVKVPLLFDEPFGDSSQIPTYVVSNFAKKSVTVSLSGDGGDELFGGYNKYVRAIQINRKLEKVPDFLKKEIMRIASGISKNALLNPFKTLTNQARKISSLLKVKGIYDLNVFLSDIHVDKKIFKNNIGVLSTVHFSGTINKSLEDILMELDFNNYLSNDILVKVDRMAMSVSLEARAPFLDPRIIDLAAKIPLKHKIHNGEKKFILKEILKDYVPSSYFDRPKRGFSVPLSAWFRDPSNKFVDEIFALYGPTDVYLDYLEITKLLNEHRKQKIDNGSLLWNIFVWYLWVNNQ